MQLQLNSCADEQLDLSICNQNSSDQCEGGGSSWPLAERSASGGAGPSSRVSVKNISDLMMITSASRENSATMTGACTIGSWSNPSADLNDSLPAAVNRQIDSSLSSRQPRMIFSSTSGAAADHERGGWSPRCYACSFCGREFNSAQALGGHMNIHRRDRARLRTSTSPASIPHDQVDLPPILPNAIHQYSAPSSLYESFNEAALIRSENPNSAISSSLNVTYTPHNIISATPIFSLLDIQPAAPDSTLLALAACPSQDEIPAAPFAVPLVDLVPFGSSSAIRFSKAPSEAHSLFSNIASQASPLFARPSLESSSVKHVEALNTCAAQASASRQVRPDCDQAASRAQLIQFSQSKGRTKRAREDDAVHGATAKSTAGQRCRHEQSSEKSNSVYAARPFVRPSTADVKGLLCLDLELRLGQSSPSDSEYGAGDCCRPWTSATAAPRPPA